MGDLSSFVHIFISLRSLLTVNNDCGVRLTHGRGVRLTHGRMIAMLTCILSLGNLDSLGRLSWHHSDK